MQRDIVSSPTRMRRVERRRTPERKWRSGMLFLRALMPLLTVGGIVLVWQLVVASELYPQFVLPPPDAVLERFYEITFGGSRISLWPHLWATLSEVLVGLAIGVSLGMSLGYLIARNRLLEDLFSPLIVAFQATPVVAYAPMLVILLGTGMESKVFTVVLIVFFPMLMNTIVGIRGVPTPLYELMRSLKATWMQVFRKLELPAAMPVLIGGLKMSVTLAVIGAVVGEFVTQNAGLGYLIVDARSSYDTPLVIASVITLTALALTLYGLVVIFERAALRWQARSR